MADVFNKIKYIETNYDVGAIEYDGVKIWPFLRIPIYSTYHNKIYNLISQIESKQTNYILNIFKRVFSAIKNTTLFLLLGRHKVLLYTDTLESRKIDDVYIDKIAKCIIENEKEILPIIAYVGGKKNLVFENGIDCNFIEMLARLNIKKINIKNVKNLEILTEIINYLGISLDLNNIIIGICRYMHFYKKWFNFIKPKRIYVNCYYDLHKMAMVYVAKQMNIKTIELQHGVIGTEHVAYQGVVDIFPNPYPDYFFSFGEKFGKFISPAIYKDNQVKYVGSFMIDYVRSNENDCKNKFHNKYGDLSGKIVITVPGEYSFDQKLLPFCKRIAEKNKDYFIVFVPRVLELYHKEYELDNLKIETELSIYECMVSSDVMSSAHSTCALESLTIGIPILLINLENEAKKFMGGFFDADTTVKYCDDDKSFDEAVNSLMRIDKKNILTEGSGFFKPDHKHLIESVLSDIELNK